MLKLLFLQDRLQLDQILTLKVFLSITVIFLRKLQGWNWIMLLKEQLLPVNLIVYHVLGGLVGISCSLVNYLRLCGVFHPGTTYIWLGIVAGEVVRASKIFCLQRMWLLQTVHILVRHHSKMSLSRNALCRIIHLLERILGGISLVLHCRDLPQSFNFRIIWSTGFVLCFNSL